MCTYPATTTKHSHGKSAEGFGRRDWGWHSKVSSFLRAVWDCRMDSCKGCTPQQLYHLVPNILAAWAIARCRQLMAYSSCPGTQHCSSQWNPCSWMLDTTPGLTWEPNKNKTFLFMIHAITGWSVPRSLQICPTCMILLSQLTSF